MAELDQSERRRAPRCSTYFFATELRGNDLYFRIVTNLSDGGFFYEEPLATSRPGDEVVMDFPLPGRREPLRVRGHVAFVAPQQGAGVRFTEHAPDEALALLYADAPIED
jgi:hypothetical protein